MVAVFMFTNDLRTEDNLTFYKAHKEHKNVLPIIVIGKQPNARMEAFLEECVADLNVDLGGKLQTYRNINELVQVHNKFGITDLYYNVDPTSPPHSTLTSTQISKWCKSKGIKEHCGKLDHTLLDFSQLTRPYKVFSNFYNTFVSFAMKVKPLYTNPKAAQRRSGSKGLAILKSINKFADYENTRDYFAKPTTHMSVYLNFGCVSMREVCYAFRNNPVLLKELMWREFYAQIVYFHPKLLQGEAFYPQRDRGWKTNSVPQFTLWKRGKTGVPLVDASMRCLNTTGYLHNRARMIVASYLVKDLGIDWRAGEAYFKSQLLDYNFASNNGGWQFISGTGASGMMQSRKFSPWIQAKKYDPECVFIKQYLPELKNVDNRKIFSIGLN